MFLAIPGDREALEQVGGNREVFASLLAGVCLCVGGEFPDDPFDGSDLHIEKMPVKRDIPPIIAVEGKQVLVFVALLKQISPVVKSIRVCIVRERDLVLLQVLVELVHTFAAETAGVVKDVFLGIVFVDVKPSGARVDHHLYIPLHIGEIGFLAAAGSIALVVVIGRHQPCGQDITSF